MAGDFKEFFIEERENLRRYRTNIEEIIKKYDRDFSDDSVINITDLSVHQGSKKLEKVHPKLFGHSKLRAYKRKEEKLNKRRCEETYCVNNNSKNPRPVEHNASGYVYRSRSSMSPQEDDVRSSHQHSPSDMYTESLDNSGQSWSSQDRSDVLSVTPDSIDRRGGTNSSPSSPLMDTGKFDDSYVQSNATYSVKSYQDRDPASLEETYHEMMTYIASDTEEPSDAETLVSSSDDSLYDSDDAPEPPYNSNSLQSLMDHNRLYSQSQMDTHLLSPQNRASESQESGYTSHDLTDETEVSLSPFPQQRSNFNGIQKNYLRTRFQIKPTGVDSFLRSRGDNLVVWQSADQIREKHHPMRSKLGPHRLTFTKDNDVMNRAGTRKSFNSTYGNSVSKTYDEPDCMGLRSKNEQSLKEQNLQLNTNTRKVEPNYQGRSVKYHEETEKRWKRITEDNQTQGFIRCHAKGKIGPDDQFRSTSSRVSMEYGQREALPSNTHCRFVTGKDILINGKGRDGLFREPLKTHTYSSKKQSPYYSPGSKASIQHIGSDREHTEYTGYRDKTCDCNSCRDEGQIYRAENNQRNSFYSESDTLCNDKSPFLTGEPHGTRNEQYNAHRYRANISSHDLNKSYESAADLTDIDDFLKVPLNQQRTKSSRFEPALIVSSLASIKGDSKKLDSNEMTSIEKVEKWREGFNSERYTLKARRRLDDGNALNRPGDMTIAGDCYHIDNDFTQRPHRELQFREEGFNWNPYCPRPNLNDDDNFEYSQKYQSTGQNSPSTTLSKLRLSSPSQCNALQSSSNPSVLESPSHRSNLHSASQHNVLHSPSQRSILSSMSQQRVICSPSQDRELRSRKSLYQESFRSPSRTLQDPPTWASPKAPVMSIRNIKDKCRVSSHKTQQKLANSGDPQEGRANVDQMFKVPVMRGQQTAEKYRLTKRGSEDSNRRGDYLRQSLLQSTPVKPTMKLCLNETISTIAAVDDDGSSEDEVVELISDQI